MCDFFSVEGFFSLSGMGGFHFFGKTYRIAPHEVIGFCLLKDLVEHPSCLADVRIGTSEPPHPFQEVFDINGTDIGQRTMIKPLLEHLQAVFVAFLCRRRNVILVFLKPCTTPI